MSRRPALLAEAVETLQRARAAVWNVLMGVGLAIGASGLVLRRRQWGESPVPADVAWRWAHLGLMGLIVASTLVRLLSVLPWAGRTPRRFVWTRVASALIGGLAVPVGLAFGWWVRPELDAVAPFWGAALVLGLLALPRWDEAELLAGTRGPGGGGRPDVEEGQR